MYKKKLLKTFSILTAIALVLSGMSNANAKTKSNDFIIKKGILIKYLGNKKTVKIPKNVKTINARAFYSNKNIRKVIIPSGVKVIEKQAFYGCVNLRNVKISDTVEIIKKAAFENCKNIEEIKIPKSVEKIENRAFIGCDNLNVVNILNKDTKIAKKAFDKSNIEELNIGDKKDKKEDEIKENNKKEDKKKEKEDKKKEKEDNGNKIKLPDISKIGGSGGGSSSSSGGSGGGSNSGGSSSNKKADTKITSITIAKKAEFNEDETNKTSELSLKIQGENLSENDFEGKIKKAQLTLTSNRNSKYEVENNSINYDKSNNILTLKIKIKSGQNAKEDDKVDLNINVKDFSYKKKIENILFIKGKLKINQANIDDENKIVSLTMNRELSDSEKDTYKNNWRIEEVKDVTNNKSVAQPNISQAGDAIINGKTIKVTFNKAIADGAKTQNYKFKISHETTTSTGVVKLEGNGNGTVENLVIKAATIDDMNKIISLTMNRELSDSEKEMLKTKWSVEVKEKKDATSDATKDGVAQEGDAVITDKQIKVTFNKEIIDYSKIADGEYFIEKGSYIFNIKHGVGDAIKKEGQGIIKKLEFSNPIIEDNTNLKNIIMDVNRSFTTIEKRIFNEHWTVEAKSLNEPSTPIGNFLNQEGQSEFFDVDGHLKMRIKFATSIVDSSTVKGFNFEVSKNTTTLKGTYDKRVAWTPTDFDGKITASIEKRTSDCTIIKFNIPSPYEDKILFRTGLDNQTLTITGVTKTVKSYELLPNGQLSTVGITFAEEIPDGHGEFAISVLQDDGHKESNNLKIKVTISGGGTNVIAEVIEG